MVNQPFTATWIVTGNNIQLAGDMARRAYLIRMDAKRSRPWQGRDFRHPDLLGWALERRGVLVGAILTLVRSWVVAGRPPGEVGIGGFDAWARTVGGILANAGVDGFLDNLGELYERIDVEAPQWEAFLYALQRHYGDAPFRSRDVVTAVTESEELKDLLPDPLDAGKDMAKLARPLGNALARKAGVRHGDGEIHLEAAPKEWQAQWSTAGSWLAGRRGPAGASAAYARKKVTSDIRERCKRPRHSPPPRQGTPLA